MTELIRWEGPGWYASQGGHARAWSRQGQGIEVLTFCFGHDHEHQPDMRGTGYGTPCWIGERPEPCAGLYVEDAY